MYVCHLWTQFDSYFRGDGYYYVSRFLNLYFRLGIAICNGPPRNGGYILKVFHALTPSMLCITWDGIVKTSVWVGGYRSYFLLFYAMLAQLLEVVATLQ